MDAETILHSKMLTTTTCGPVEQSASHQPITEQANITHQSDDDMFAIIQQATAESFWKAHGLVSENHGILREESTGNTLLHSLVLALRELAQRHRHTLCDASDADDYDYSNEWIGAAVGLTYRIVVTSRCSVNAQNNKGNTALHLACLRPYANILTKHLIRLGADPQIRNQYGVHVHYNPTGHCGWLIKGFPGLRCGIWDAIRREDCAEVNRFLSTWCRTVANQPTGQSIFEVAMATGNYDLVRCVDKARTTNELIAASIALDVPYMQELLSARLERDKCDLNTLDTSYDPPRPITAELHLVLAKKAEEVIRILEQYGAPGPNGYLADRTREEFSFEVCSFVRTVKNANKISDLEKAWQMVGQPGFKVTRRRRDDKATYLHFLTERYLLLSANPTLQRGIVRLMFRVAAAGVDLQARDCCGRTALVLAAEGITGLLHTACSLSTPTDKIEGGIIGMQNENLPNTLVQTPEKSAGKPTGQQTQPDPAGGFQEDDEEQPFVKESENPNRSIRSDSIRSIDDYFEQVRSRLHSLAQTNYSTQTILERSSNSALESEVRSSPTVELPNIPDQSLLLILLQIGVDSSLTSAKNECIQREFYLPRGVLNCKKRGQTSQSTNTAYRPVQDAMEDFPGLWPNLDNLLHAVMHDRTDEEVTKLFNRVEKNIREYLCSVRAKRNGLTALELARASLPPSHCCYGTSPTPSHTSKKSVRADQTGHHISKSVGQRTVEMLQSYLSLTDFGMAAMSGDVEKMKYYLALGRGEHKTKAHYESYYNGTDEDLRAKFMRRPLIVSVMEYSTTEAVEVMIENGADLREFYAASEPHGPAAFWAFRDFVSLRKTFVVAKSAATDLRDANGATMLHHAVSIFHRLLKDDANGRRWASLITLTLLTRGVKVEARDRWGRTARDLAGTVNSALCGSESSKEHAYRALEEEAPDPYELRDITDPVTGELLLPEALIDRRVAQLAYFDQLEALEDLILSGYDCLHLAKMGFIRTRTAIEIAEVRGYSDVYNLLRDAQTYQNQIIEIQRTVIDGDHKTFSRMSPEKRKIRRVMVLLLIEIDLKNYFLLFSWSSGSTIQHVVDGLNLLKFNKCVCTQPTIVSKWKALQLPQCLVTTPINQTNYKMDKGDVFFSVKSAVNDNRIILDLSSNIKRYTLSPESRHFIRCTTKRLGAQLGSTVATFKNATRLKDRKRTDRRGRSLLHLAVLYRQRKLALLLVDLCPKMVNSTDCLGRTPLHYAICLNDNRGLFLKIVAQLGSVDKQQKDLVKCISGTPFS
ncbi:unnamed protein product [Calicophoron daubneyi]|uniref:Uncharacterized protein n=1 Tax=Calicophoron daubneyi TaxID=300641 RepID=A0AAV2TWH0_CALDB